MAESKKSLVEQNVPRGTLNKIEEYVSTLLTWNKDIALLSKKMPREDVFLHIMDSVLLYNDVIMQRGGGAVVDVGSGNGLVGIVLAMLGAQECYLVEKNFKKSLFLREAVRKFDLNNHAKVINADISICSNLGAKYFVAKAFGSIELLLDCTKDILLPGSSVVVYKGKERADQEILDSKTKYSFDYEYIPQSHRDEGVIVIMDNIREE